MVPQSWHILPQTGAQVFQYWGDRTNSYFTPVRNQFLDILFLKTHNITLKLMSPKKVPRKNIEK